MEDDSSSENQEFEEQKQKVEITQFSKNHSKIYDFKYNVQMPFQGSYFEFSSERLKPKISIFKVVLKSLKDSLSFVEFMNDSKNQINGQLKGQVESVKKQVFILVFKIFLKHVLCFLSFLRKKIPLFELNKQLSDPKTNLMISSKDSKSKNDSSKVFIYFKIDELSTSEDKSGQKINEPHSFDPNDRSSNSEENKFKRYLNKFNDNKSVVILPSSKSGFYLIFKTKEASNELGSGGYGIVHRAQYIVYREGKYVQETWAIKELKKKIGHHTSSSGIGYDRQWHMLTAMKAIKNFQESRWSENIIKIDEFFEESSRRYIVYEYCPFQDLSKFCKPEKAPYFSKTTKKHIFLLVYNLIATLKFIHYDLFIYQHYLNVFSEKMEEDGEIRRDKEMFKENVDNKSAQIKGIIHRDLKPGNIAIKNFGEHWIHLKVIDWAFSKPTLTEFPCNNLHCGTDTYLAPEFDDGTKKYCCKVDVWAFGVTVFYLLTGTSLLHKTDNSTMAEEKIKVEFKIKEMKFLTSKNLNEEEKQFYKEVLRRSLQVDPEKRSSSKDLFEFISSNNIYTSLNKSDRLFLLDLKILRVRWNQLYSHLYHQSRIQLFKSVLSSIDQKIDVMMENLYNKKMELVYAKTEDDVQFLREIQQEREDFKKSKDSYYQESGVDLSKLKKQSAKEEFEKILFLFAQFKQFFDPSFLEKVTKIMKMIIEKWEKLY